MMKTLKGEKWSLSRKWKELKRSDGSWRFACGDVWRKGFHRQYLPFSAKSSPVLRWELDLDFLCLPPWIWMDLVPPLCCRWHPSSACKSAGFWFHLWPQLSQLSQLWQLPSPVKSDNVRWDPKLARYCCHSKQKRSSPNVYNTTAVQG